LIDPNLFADPQPVDRIQHRTLRADFGAVHLERAAHLNSLFIALGEFGLICQDLPIVFVEAGANEAGQREVAPVAVFGLAQGENLALEGGRWTARYVPALLRGYPFGVARAGGDNYVMVVDVPHAGLSATEGEPLFDDKGEPSEALKERQRFVEQFEVDAQQTRLACQRLLELELLKPMRFDATLPDGTTITLDGFLTVDGERLGALPDAQVVEMHRSGLLGLIHAHLISLPTMRQLVERRVDRAQALAAAAAPENA
jgi:hypothetical protein